MDNKILFIAPTENLAKLAEHIIKKEKRNVSVKIGYLSNAGGIAAKFIESGGKVIISRKGTKTFLEETLGIPVVGIEVTTADYIDIFKVAKKVKGVVGFFSYEKVPENVKTLCYLLNIQGKYYEFFDDRSCKQMVKQAISDGAVLGVGGALTAEYSVRYGLEHITVENSDENIEAALNLAAAMVQQILQDEETERLLRLKLERYETIFNYTHDGIMAIDEKGRVEVVNKQAEKMIPFLGKPPYTGKIIETIFPNSKLPRVVKSGQKELDQLMNFKDTIINTNRVPIILDGEVKGVVATFQDVEAIKKSEQKIRINLHKHGLVSKYTFDDFIGESPAMRNSIKIAMSYAKSESTILLEGESGTGKELFAHSMHHASNRRDAPFVAINCTAIPQNLLESELFGYEEGSFTGAKRGGKAGLFELAHHGTLFLDEIGEISKEMQVQLLRAIQEREIRRIGGDKLIPVDIRIITATNLDLREAVHSGCFREDLYYRINVLNLKIPPLRDRGDDFKLIALHMFKKFLREDFKIYESSIEWVLAQLSHYRWPGNVRQLYNMSERVAVMLQSNMSPQNIVDLFLNNKSDQMSGSRKIVKSGSLETWEKENILNNLKMNKLNIAKTARDLGYSRSTLYKKMAKYGISSQ